MHTSSYHTAFVILSLLISFYPSVKAAGQAGYFGSTSTTEFDEVCADIYRINHTSEISVIASNSKKMWAVSSGGVVYQSNLHSFQWDSISHININPHQNTRPTKLVVINNLLLIQFQTDTVVSLQISTFMGKNKIYCSKDSGHTWFQVLQNCFSVSLYSEMRVPFPIISTRTEPLDYKKPETFWYSKDSCSTWTELTNTRDMMLTPMMRRNNWIFFLGIYSDWRTDWRGDGKILARQKTLANKPQIVFTAESDGSLPFVPYLVLPDDWFKGIFEHENTLFLFVNDLYHAPLKNTGCYFSRDSGATWTKIDTVSRFNQHFTCFYAKHNLICLGTRSGLWYSVDFGATWKKEDKISSPVNTITSVGGMIVCGVAKAIFAHDKYLGPDYKVHPHSAYFFDPLARSWLPCDAGIRYYALD